MTRAEEDKVTTMNAEIAGYEKFIKENEHVSAEKFNESDEIRIGLEHNKRVYSYYSIVGTEIPRKLWLTSLSLGNHIIIEGQADNLESVYSFYRNIKDYNPTSGIKLQKLALASKVKFTPIEDETETKEGFDADSILTSLNADFYEFRITDAPDAMFKVSKKEKESAKKDGVIPGLGDLESIE